MFWRATEIRGEAENEESGKDTANPLDKQSSDDDVAGDKS
jgi:hypothetical protein